MCFHKSATLSPNKRDKTDETLHYSGNQMPRDYDQDSTRECVKAGTGAQ